MNNLPINPYVSRLINDAQCPLYYINNTDFNLIEIMVQKATAKKLAI